MDENWSLKWLLKMSSNFLVAQNYLLPLLLLYLIFFPQLVSFKKIEPLVLVWFTICFFQENRDACFGLIVLLHLNSCFPTLIVSQSDLKFQFDWLTHLDNHPCRQAFCHLVAVCIFLLLFRPIEMKREEGTILIKHLKGRLKHQENRKGKTRNDCFHQIYWAFSS